MDKNRQTGNQGIEKIPVLYSVRTRIIGMAMGAIVIVGLLMLAIFSLMSSKQFKDMVVGCITISPDPTERR